MKEKHSVLWSLAFYYEDILDCATVLHLRILLLHHLTFSFCSI